jgi:hypothetical protein
MNPVHGDMDEDDQAVQPSLQNQSQHDAGESQCPDDGEQRPAIPRRAMQDSSGSGLRMANCRRLCDLVL